jgi:hypothetical protein
MKRQASVQDISWFIDLDNRKQLDLNPPYQRRSVWTASDRKFFLDTIFRNYPCPPIFIHKTINDSGESTYHIVDGKQRLETILLFAGNKIAMDKDFGDERLDALRFKKISQKMKQNFWNYSLPVDFIMDINDLDINQVFDRVNRNSRNLGDQELRHARYNGWFIQEVEKDTDEDVFWENIKVTSKAKAKRMKDVQLVSELMLIIIDEKIVGFDQNYLNDRYAQFDSLEDEEGELLFDIDEYIKKKASVKKIIIEMENHNNCITEKAKTNNNLYTLFALIILEDTSSKSSTEFADIYNEFMDLVDAFRKADDSEKLLKPAEVESKDWDAAYLYAKATTGASTDLPQRKDRLDALKTLFL